MRSNKSQSILQVALALSTLGLGGGCELAVPLVVAGTTNSGPDEPIPGEFVPTSMSMELVESEGYVVDDEVGSLNLFVPFELDLLSGFLFVGVEGASTDVTGLHIGTCDLARGDGDPYGGLDQPVVDEPEGGRPIATTPCGAPEELVGACDDFGTCTHPESVEMRRVATAGGTELELDASWGADRPLFLRFREVR